MAISDTSRAILLSSLFQVPGQVLGAIQGNQADAAANENQAAFARANLLNTYVNWMNSRDQGMGQALASIGDPLSHARSRSDFATKRSFLFDGPGGGPQWIMPKSANLQARMPNMPRFDSAKPFYSDEAMLSSEMPYWQAMSALTGGKVGPAFQASGYKDQPASMAQHAINQALWRDAYQRAQMDAQFQGQYNNQSAALQQALQAKQQQKGTPWWKKALGMAGMVGSMFIPGLQGLGPVAMGLLRAGVGAAGGALAGGKKGALLGGAMGGFSSLPIPGIQNVPGIGSAPGAKGMTGLKNLFTGNFMGTLPSTASPGTSLAGASAMSGPFNFNAVAMNGGFGGGFGQGLGQNPFYLGSLNGFGPATRWQQRYQYPTMFGVPPFGFPNQYGGYGTATGRLPLGNR